MASSEPPRKPIQATTTDALNSAIDKAEKESGPSEASQHAERAPGTAKNGQDNGKNWKIVGGVLAAVAAVALGGYALKQRKSRKEKAEEEARGLLDQAGQKLKSGGRWFGEKAETVKEKAGNVTDDIAPRVKSAASTTKEKVGEAIPSGVADTAAGIKDRVNVAGIEAEKKGLKASETSDSVVRDTADKVIKKSSHAAHEVDDKSGGFFSGLKHWLADRKDDTADLAGSAWEKAEDAVSSASDAVKGKK